MQKLIEKITELSDRSGLSDVHLHGNHPVYLRSEGCMYRLSDDVVTADEIWHFAEYFMTPELKQRWLDEKSVDFSIQCENCRYRANFYFASAQPAAALRKLAVAAPNLEALGMPPVIKSALASANGLVLLTGATGSGKSTSLASMVDYILDIRAVHLITIEDPVEFFFQSRRSLVSQREVGSDAPSFSSALRASFREDPDVILIGEMRDPETIGLALTAAETGHLVLATLHTSSCVGAISRIIDVFSSEAKDQIRLQLAQSLRMVVNQRLLNRCDDGGRVAAFEVLFVTDATRNLIRENKGHQLHSLMDTSRAQGTTSMRAAIASLYTAGIIGKEQMNVELTSIGGGSPP